MDVGEDQEIDDKIYALAYRRTERNMRRRTDRLRHVTGKGLSIGRGCQQQSVRELVHSGGLIAIANGQRESRLDEHLERYQSFLALSACQHRLIE